MTSDAAPRHDSNPFAKFYLALALSLALVGVWNAERLSARADMIPEGPLRSWALASIDTVAGESLRARERLLAHAMSDSFRPDPIELPAAPKPTLGGGRSAAQAAPAPARSGSAASAALAASPPPATIAFVGDSLANGYAAGASRALSEAKSAAKSIDDGKISSGLVSKSYFDWPARAKAICAAGAPGAMVFSFGANDPMDMREGGAFLRFGSDAWVAAYEARALNMVDIAKSCGAKAVWLSLPPMRDPEMIRKAAILRRAQARACAAADACVKPFEELGEPSESEFSERAKADGRERLLRAQDGIHMAPYGYYMVAKQALAKLGVAGVQPSGN